MELESSSSNASEKVRFIIDTDGNIKMEVFGIKGTGCDQVIKQFQSLGTIKTNKAKLEYYDNPNPIPPNSNKNSNLSLQIVIQENGEIQIPWIPTEFQEFVQTLLPPEDQEDIIFGPILCG